ncbi:hypothetical protein EXIGLDRAFT_768325 [Exidia glandulosa HHB12029]|uniref:Uncharacterized protein n=1 Tax=Exidia glandulosa HHB12029 TaxID=1314781 RepID=A0A165I9V1_EXIGL|nr:hypothetical protein EXIGLDRAFT_768325 [Exidia glandulosa HHB12029]
MSVLNAAAESALALLDEDRAMCAWSTLRYNDSTGRGCSLMLLAVNALAYYLSLTDPTIMSYAAGVYTTRHDKGEKLTILVSGSGPIPTATQKIAERIVASLTATANASPPSSTPVADLFAELTLHALDEWRRRANVDDQDI